jgi:hypothetical protein
MLGTTAGASLSLVKDFALRHRAKLVANTNGHKAAIMVELIRIEI